MSNPTDSTLREMAAKKRLPAIQTTGDLVAAVKRTAALMMDRDTRILRRDEALAAIHAEHGAAIEGLEADVKRNVRALRAYAIANRKELFGDEQTITVLGNELHFQGSPGKVELTVEEEIFLDALLTADRALFEEVVTVRSAISKETILRHYREGGPAWETIKAAGASVEKPETFSFTPAARADIPATEQAA